LDNFDQPHSNTNVQTSTFLHNIDQPHPSNQKPHPSNLFNQPLQSTTSINHFNQPLQQSTPSLTVGGLLASGQSAGWSSQLSTSTHHQINYPDQPPRSTTPSLAVAGFGFRTIGRLVKQPLESTHFNHQDQPLPA
jgi:hypothetical protein